MSECIAMLDKALEIGEREIACLVEGDVETAETMASDRVRLMHEASKEFPGQDAGVLRDRLERLLSLQERATSEAKSLKEDIAKKLGRTKKEVRRFAGYSGASKNTPIVQNVYLNKQG